MKLIYCVLLFASFASEHYSKRLRQPLLREELVKCQYTFRYKLDSTSAYKETVFTLLIGGNNSVFKENKAIIADSLLAIYSKLPFSEQNFGLFNAQLKQMPIPAFTYFVRKNLLTHKVVYEDKIGKNRYQYVEPGLPLAWHITQEYAKIAGFNCQKATLNFAGRSWEAWFTREIPISDGPYKFHGLPGLIIKVNDNKNYFVFNLLMLQQAVAGQLLALPGKDVLLVTKKEFVKGKTAYAAGAADRIAAMGNMVTDAQKQAYQVRLRKQNNPVELK